MRERKRRIHLGPASQAAASQTQSRAYRMKERYKAPVQNVDEEKQVKLNYKS